MGIISQNEIPVPWPGLNIKGRKIVVQAGFPDLCGGAAESSFHSVFASRVSELLSENPSVVLSVARKNLAEALGVSLPAVRKWENGLALPEPEKMVVIASMFNVSLDWLLGRTVVRDLCTARCAKYPGVVAMPLVEEKDGFWSYSKLINIPTELLSKDESPVQGGSAYLLLRSPSDSMWPTIRKQELVLVKYGINHFDENEILLLSFDNHLAIRRLQRRLGVCAIMADNRNHYPEVVIENEHVTFFGATEDGAFDARLFSPDEDPHRVEGRLNKIFASEGKSVLVIGRVIGCTRLFG